MIRDSNHSCLLVECCFTSTETVGLLGTGTQDDHLDFYTAPELGSLSFQCCFTSTETVGLLGTGAQDGHLDFHTAPELGSSSFQCCFTSTETVGLLGTGAQDGHLDFYTTPELCILVCPRIPGYKSFKWLLTALVHAGTVDRMLKTSHYN